MKLTENYRLKNIAGEIVIIPIGKAAQCFNGLISTNTVSGFILENIEKCKKSEDMVKLVLETFEVTEDIAKKEVLQFLEDLKKAGMIECEEDNK